MDPPSARFTLEGGRIRLGDDVFVHLERMLAPGGPLPPEVGPRSYGLSPTARSPSGIAAAVAPGEAVWLGLQAVDRARPAIVRARVDRPQPIDAVTGGSWEDALAEEPRNYLVSPPDSRLTGVRQSSGYLPFGLGSQPEEGEIVERIIVLSYGERPAFVPVELVRPDVFTALSGVVPEPLDPDAAYKGWRLP